MQWYVCVYTLNARHIGNQKPQQQVTFFSPALCPTAGMMVFIPRHVFYESNCVSYEKPHSEILAKLRKVWSEVEIFVVWGEEKEDQCVLKRMELDGTMFINGKSNASTNSSLPRSFCWKLYIWEFKFWGF